LQIHSIVIAVSDIHQNRGFSALPGTVKQRWSYTTYLVVPSWWHSLTAEPDMIVVALDYAAQVKLSLMTTH
jgi:hypothetical protein